MALILELVELSLFCPKAYLRRLLAENIVPGPACNPPPGNRAQGDRLGPRAIRHARYLQHMHPRLFIALEAWRTKDGGAAGAAAQGMHTELPAAALPATPPLPGWDAVGGAAAEQLLGDAAAGARRRSNAPDDPYKLLGANTGAGAGTGGGAAYSSWQVFSAARRVLLARCGSDAASARKLPPSSPAQGPGRGGGKARGLAAAAPVTGGDGTAGADALGGPAAAGSGPDAPMQEPELDPDSDADHDLDLDLVVAACAWLGVPRRTHTRPSPGPSSGGGTFDADRSDRAGKGGGGRGGGGRGGEAWLCQGPGLVGAVAALKPWQKRALLLAVLDAVAARFCAAGLTPPSLRAGQAAQRAAVQALEQALLGTAAPGPPDRPASATAAGTGGGNTSAALPTHPSYPQQQAPLQPPPPLGGAGALPLPLPSLGDMPLPLGEDEDDAMLLSLLLEPTPSMSWQQGQAAAPWGEQVPPSLATPEAGLGSAPGQAANAAAAGGQAAVGPAAQLQRLPGGMWLQRACALLDACDAGDACAALLCHLVQVHVAAVSATAAAASGSGGGSAPATVSSPLAALQVAEGVLLACVEAWKDR